MLMLKILRHTLPLLQVRHAQQAGAAAAIVYDNAYEPLIIMSKPAGHASPGIPAVFISQKSGIIMKKLMTPGVTIAHIMPVRPCTQYPTPPTESQLQRTGIRMGQPHVVPETMGCIDGL